MTDVPQERLSSSYLEDLAFTILSARVHTSDVILHPELTDEDRARLRSRLKQLARHDFPASLTEDKALRRGYTLRQCCRLTIALLLIDAHLPASLAVVLARNNEPIFLRAIAKRLAAGPQSASGPEDLIAVIISGELQDALASAAWLATDSGRVRLVRRDGIGGLWSDDLSGSGARLVVDVATAAGALWNWISARRLMTDLALKGLLVEIEQGGPAFSSAKDGGITSKQTT